jgi:hypothetical protein
MGAGVEAAVGGGLCTWAGFGLSLTTAGAGSMGTEMCTSADPEVATEGTASAGSGGGFSGKGGWGSATSVGMELRSLACSWCSRKRASRRTISL